MTTLTDTGTVRGGAFIDLLRRVRGMLRQSAERRVAFLYEQPWKAQ